MSDLPPSPQLSTIKRALLEVRRLRTRVAELERARTEPIAIVGLGLRFPGGARDAASFWKLLRNGEDALSSIPPDRWDGNVFYDPDPDAPGKMCARRMGFIEDVDRFDPAFFNLAPREAELMDPQHRLLLEVSWEAIENAGIPPAGLNGSETGVFIGVSNSDSLRGAFADPATVDAYASSGNAYSMAAGRLAYFLGLQGPALAIDTACSSSLVAVHQACQSLRLGECGMALAGGVNLILSPEVCISLSNARMLSPEGQCRAFDAAADGFARGEGCGVVVLKLLSSALAAGDSIRAVILGSAVNQDGRSNGITAPNGAAQEALIRSALANSGVAPEAVQFVEAHGTGTALGDPIEAHALAATIGRGRTARKPLFLGSVKANVGHLEAAAGIAGLIKTVLAMEFAEIPPQPHFRTLNPAISLEGAGLEVPATVQPWPAVERRVAGVSSFGFSGTNVHMVVQSAPALPDRTAIPEPPLNICPLSARTPEALAALAARWKTWLGEQPEAPLADVCYSAGAGRSHFPYRLAPIAASTGELRQKLSGFPTPAARTGERPRVAFLFPGQGSQFPGMARELYEIEPVFRETLRECAGGLAGFLDLPLERVLFGPDTALLGQTAYAQPALFAVEYALSRLWRNWGVEPDLVIGHSLGEIVAACAAGVFSPTDGIRLAAERGRLMQGLAGGGIMIALWSAEAVVAEILMELGLDPASVSIAAVNGPENVVISGETQAVQAVADRCAKRRIRAQRLNVSHAFHSPLMQPVLKEFRQCAAALRYQEAELSVVAGETGRLAGRGEMSTANYWVRQLERPVRFWDSVKTAWESGVRVFLEVGPGSTLASLGQRGVPGNKALWLASLRPRGGEWRQILESLGGLYESGVEVDWEAFHRPYGRSHISLPPYPFERHLCLRDRPSPVPAAHAKPIWPSVAAAAAFQASQCPLDLDWANYPARWACLDRFTRSAITAALGGMGAFQTPKERQTPESLTVACGVTATHRNLLARWLDRLADAGLLQVDPDGSFRAPVPLPATRTQPFTSTERDLFANETGLLEYVEACGLQLMAILRGQASPLEPLFPGGSFTRAESIYELSPLARYCNAIIRAAVEAFIGARPGIIRILELGAGTGSTAATVLPALPSERCVYHYTDVSETFLTRGKQKLGAHSGVEYAILDLERPPAEQNFEAHGFDIILGVNIVHATRNLDRSLAHIHTLLAPGGLLILSELTRKRSWFDISSGLIEGWQRAEDRRKADPLLTGAEWIATLSGSGFAQVLAAPDSPALVEILGQQVFLAGMDEKGVRTRPAGAGGARIVTLPPLEESPNGTDWAAMLRGSDAQARRELLRDFVAQRLAQVLRMDATRLDRRQRLIDLGLDSLMAIEFRNLLSDGLGLGRQLPATLVFDYPTMEAVSDYLETEMFGSDPAPPVKADALDSAAEALAGLSESEVEALLQNSLKEIFETNR